jgi:hypothetical protein
MKSNQKIVAAAMLAAMSLAYVGCKKDSVNPVKASTYHPATKLATYGDSLSGGDQPPIPPR